MIDDLVVRGGPGVWAPKGKVLPLSRPGTFTLWDPSRPVPRSADAPLLEDVRFHVIKRRRPAVDGYNWLHGVAVCWHEGKLYASFGHNTGSENTATEIAQGRVSADAGKTWGPVFRIASGQGPRAVSHGVFLSDKGTLWAFHGSFFGRMGKVHTRAYVLDAKTGAWQAKGVVAEKGFWACAAPQKMADGNWIMAGMSVDAGYGGTDPAAVAISRGDDLTKWDVVRIPLKPGLGHVWGESTVIVNGKEVLNIARYGGKAIALASVSEDFGRTWTTMAPTNLPMAGSKPYAGVLSTGQRYLVCTTTRDSGHRRSPLTIAVSRPGGKLFCKVFRIRDAGHVGPGESTPKARLSYPYAVEHEGKLYVAYSNDGGRGGNRNSAEMAIIPVKSLAVSNALRAR